MDRIVTSGMILIEKNGKEFILSKINGFFHNTLVKTTSDYFGDLLFVTKCLDFNESKLSRGGALKTNNVSILRTPTDEYEIKLGFNSFTLREADMVDLMQCLKSLDGRDEDEMTLKYGFKKDNRPSVKTIRDRMSFSGYSPSIIEGHFSLSVEDDGQIVIYYLTKWGDWVDAFSLNSDEMINHLRQNLIMVKDCMICERPIQIVSPWGTFKYSPEYGSSTEVVINGRQKILNKNDISDLICVIGSLC